MEQTGFENFSQFAPPPREATENEYLKDGLFYCKTCNEPTQKRQGGFPYPVPISCLCKRQETERRETAERQKKTNERREKAFESKRSKRLGFTFANDDERNKRATELLKQYCETFAEHRAQGEGYILHSNQNGGGKTFLACAVANELIDKGYNVLVTNFLTLRDKLFEPRAFSFVNKVDFLNSLCAYDLVVIDDLGAEQSTEFTLEVEYRIIDKLVDENIPLILTTNYTLAELRNEENITKRRVFDRIMGCCALLSIEQPNGKSRRVEKCAELTKKMA